MKTDTEFYLDAVQEFRAAHTEMRRVTDILDNKEARGRILARAQYLKTNPVPKDYESWEAVYDLSVALS